MYRVSASMAAAGVLACTSVASAGLIVHETFDPETGYAVGSRLGTEPNPEAGPTAGEWTSDWSTDLNNFEVIQTPLSYEANGTVLGGVGGAIASRPTGNHIRGRQFERFHESDGDAIYFSALFEAESFSSGSNRMFAGLANNNIARLAAFRIRQDGNVQTDTMHSIIEHEHYLDAGQTYLLVSRVEFDPADPGDPGDLRVTYWINPDLDEEGANAEFSFAQDIQSSNRDNHAADRIHLFAQSGYPDEFTLDNFRVGTTYASVIPEPGTLSLLGIGALLAMRRRRASRA